MLMLPIKKYVDTEIKKSSQKSSHPQENAFKYLMSDINQTSTEYGMVVDGYVNYEQSFHDNKKVISFKANLDGSNFRYRIGFELGLIQVNNDFTISIEQLFRNQNYWKAAQITISGTGVTLPFTHTEKYQYVVNNVDYYYIKTIVQFRKITAPSHFIYYTTHIDNLINPPSEISLDMLVYGVKGSFHNVDENVYNEVLFKVVNDRIQPKKEFDMNNQKIVNVLDGVNNNDAVNKSQLDTNTSALNGAGSDTILTGKTPIYNSQGALYMDRIRIRNASNILQIILREQTGNYNLYIPDLGGKDQTIQFKESGNKYHEEYIRGAVSSNSRVFQFNGSQYFQIPYPHTIKKVVFRYVKTSGSSNWGNPIRSVLRGYTKLGGELNLFLNSSSSGKQVQQTVSIQSSSSINSEILYALHLTSDFNEEIIVTIFADDEN